MKNFIRVVGEFEHVDATCLKKIETEGTLKRLRHNLPLIIFLKILNVG